MAKEKVLIDKKELECLREHLDSALKIFQSLGISVGDVQKSPAKPKKPRKVSFAQKVRNYDELIRSGKKRTLPKHLQK